MKTLKTIESMLNKIDAALGHAKTLRSKIYAPFQKKLDAIKAAQEKAVKGINTKIDNLEKSRDNAEKQIRDAIAAQKRQGFKSRAPQTHEEFTEWIKVCKIDSKIVDIHYFYYSLKAINVQNVPAGMSILGATDGCTKIYVAFRKNKMIGYLLVKMARHAADSTEAEGEIKGKQIKFDINRHGWNASVSKPVSRFINLLKRA